MFRRFVFSLIVVLLVSPQGFADIAQNQDYGIGSSLAALLEGTGTVGDGKIVVVCLGQTITQHSCLWAIQDDNAIFTQRAGAVGWCALLGVLQNGSAVGEQFQLIAGYSGPKAQGQALEVGLAQDVAKSGGAGTVTASHEFIADRLQTLGSPSGSMSADQFVNAAQDANVQGVPCTDGVVISGVYFSATQAQAGN